MRRRLVTSIVLLSLAGCGGDDLVLPTESARERLVMLQGDQQVGRPGSRLPDVLLVRLVDRESRGIADRVVVWKVSSGGGSITPPSVRTDPEGYASAQWTLGDVSGQQAARAEVPGVGEVTFVARGGTVPDAGRSRIAATPDQIAVGATSTITVTVRDSDGEAVEGATVALTASGAAATLTQPDTPTSAEGVATGRLQGLEPGAVEVKATVDGAIDLDAAVVVTVTGGSPPPSGVSRLVFQVEPRDVRTNERFAVEVSLVDAGGSVVPLSGIVVYLALFPQGSDVPANKHLQGSRFESSEAGTATFELSVKKKGSYRLRALTDDLPELGPHGPEPYLYSDYFEVN